MTHLEIRKKFKKFFSAHNHTWMKSSPLPPPPGGDPSLLFINAGMNPFKHIFLGLEPPPNSNLSSIQKCLRAGGKHNDLEEVGASLYHHTFFEMMGNFSFGGYFKKSACALAWDFLTKEMNIPPQHLAVSFFKEDQETAEIWRKMGLPRDKIFPLGEKDNFWRMGEEGPCGPCSEIYYDPRAFRCGKDNMVEVWNLVFMQYQEDKNKNKSPLSRNCIDTGMGLERLCAIIQGGGKVLSNYNTDLFSKLLSTALQAIHSSSRPGEENPTAIEQKINISARVLADHVRAACFLIADGIQPGPEKQSYILRRILRRAVYYGSLWGEKSFLPPVAQAVIEVYADPYPELKNQKEIILTTLKEEEEKFFQSLDHGKARLEKEIKKIKQKGEASLDENISFQLYDTFGFPFDLIELICRKHGIKVFAEKFKKKLALAKEKSKKKSVFKEASLSNTVYDEASRFPEGFNPSAEGMFYIPSKTPPTKFLGYESLNSLGKLTALFDENHKKINSASAPKKKLFAVFDKTCFYAEGGGQTGDQGSLDTAHSSLKAQVEDCQNRQGYYFHQIALQKGSLIEGGSYNLQVSGVHRQKTAVHHSATHLLNQALRQILGDHIRQAGSLVRPHGLRFDFTARKALSDDELAQVEDLVIENIQKALPVTVHYKNYQQALDDGALSFFDKPQKEKVRVLKMGSFSMELCGGTHVQNTKDILYFKILAQSSVGSGTRRIEAVGGLSALRLATNLARENLKLRKHFHISAGAKNPSALFEQVQKLQNQIQSLKKSKPASSFLLPKVVETFYFQSKKGSFYTSVRPAESSSLLAAFADQIKEKFPLAVVALAGSAQSAKTPIVTAVPSILAGTVSAGEIISALGGKGGGPPTFAKGVLPQPAAPKHLREKILKLFQSKGLLKDLN